MLAPFIFLYLLYLSALLPEPGLVLPPMLRRYPLGTPGSTTTVGSRAPIVRGSVVRDEHSALELRDSDVAFSKTSNRSWKLP